MAQLEYFLVAQGISVDQRTNNVTLFNVIDQIVGQQFPSAHPELVVVSAWNADPGDNERDFQVCVRITPPVGAASEFRQNMRIPGRRARALLYFQGFPIEAPGVLRFELLLNGDPQAHHSIDVVQAAQPAG